MPLTASIDSPQSLYRKLEREAYRAFHARTPLQKADHFFNFCVTASSMRDYCFEHLGATTKAQQKPYHDAWWKLPLLVAAVEIGNATKHFTLRDHAGAPRSVQTRALRFTKATLVEIYERPDGELLARPAQRREISVTLSNGRRLELYAFTAEVLAYWRSFLASIGIKVRRQPFARLAGAA